MAKSSQGRPHQCAFSRDACVRAGQAQGQCYMSSACNQHATFCPHFSINLPSQASPRFVSPTSADSLPPPLITLPCASLLLRVASLNVSARLITRFFGVLGSVTKRRNVPARSFTDIIKGITGRSDAGSQGDVHSTGDGTVRPRGRTSEGEAPRDPPSASHSRVCLGASEAAPICSQAAAMRCKSASEHRGTACASSSCAVRASTPLAWQQKGL